jgi:2-polyprenyl-6-methoxyphenol hydroxylase-like FAD-dependent oxidoreductase
VPDPTERPAETPAAAPARTEGETTTCCIVGGGPAGATLGLLLARAGVDVVVLEKHGDFLRDFRGDTIHPSTLEVLDELGLRERFDKLPHHKTRRLSMITDGEETTVADFGRLPAGFDYIAFVPQWDFLNLITEAAAEYPNFRLIMNAEAYDLILAPGRAEGVRYRDTEGTEHELRALLTVAADGRNSVLRGPARLKPREFGAPMDVAWFRLPREDGDRADPFLRLSTGKMMVGINRTTYWQLAYMFPKGGYERVRAQGIETMRAHIREMMPFLEDRLDGLDFDAVSVLEVRVDRLRRWWRPGLLFIGDAAHAMSPIGGVGINLAIQDAVAAANILTEPLRRGEVRDAELAAVQRRRALPTALTQRLQLLIQARVIARILRGRGFARPPLALRLAGASPLLGDRVARAIAYGVRPEHVRVPAARDPGAAAT